MAFGLGNIGSLLKNAKKMQEMMQQQQAELANTVVEVNAGAGAVVLKMNCKHEVLDLQISDEVVGNKDVLRELIMGAYNSANQQIVEKTQAGMMGAADILGMGDMGDMNLGDMLGTLTGQQPEKDKDDKDEK